MKKELEKYLKEITGVDLSLERITDEKFGDYASNVAFRLSKEQRKSPMEVANDLASKIKEEDKGNYFSEIQAAAPGFINFRVEKRVFIEYLSRKGYPHLNPAHKIMYGINPPPQREGGKEKINLEFVSANPTGPLTMANGRGGFLGHALANVLEEVGYNVTREYYINDAGVQIRKLGASLLAALKLIPESPDHYQGGYVKELAGKLKIKIFKKRDPSVALRMTPTEIEEVGRLAAKELLARIKKSLKNVGIKHDVWFSEYKELRQKKALEKTLAFLRSKNMVYERDGAVWLRTTETKNQESEKEIQKQGEIASSDGHRPPTGDHPQGDNDGKTGLSMTGDVEEEKRDDDKDRVLKKSDGEYTYFLGDLAYHYNKFIERKFDKAIVIWGADHHGYVGRVKSGVGAMGVEPERFQAIITQLIRLVRDGEEVKMSKRAGEFITLDDLVKEVGKDAARFFFLMHTPNTHMDFDLDLAKEKSVKNPVYYLQYALVRCGSILQKSGVRGRKSELLTSKLEILNSESEVRLIKNLTRLDDEILRTAEDLEVSRLVRYGLELAKTFHNFYEKEHVIVEDKNLMQARLALVLVAKNVFERLFDILGITKLKKM